MGWDDNLFAGGMAISLGGRKFVGGVAKMVEARWHIGRGGWDSKLFWEMGWQ